MVCLSNELDDGRVAAFELTQEDVQVHAAFHVQQVDLGKHKYLKYLFLFLTSSQPHHCRSLLLLRLVFLIGFFRLLLTKHRLDLLVLHRDRVGHFEHLVPDSFLLCE